MAGFQNEKSNMNSNFVSEDPNSNSDVKPVSIFSNDYKKHEDLKQMLDSNKENLKLDAMKRIVGMIAKGKNASDLFPAVVKNVVSKNVEIKKLVYVYLMRYAEEQQDLALLSISTFQRALKDPNQLIRASALRVLSSIRVPIITTIMMLAIKEAVTDMSPYVRKTAANAITKLYNLDPELKDELIEIIEKLLADKTILVAGSAIQAFEEVCPDRIDLIHKNYRKLCNLLIDVDEWGQVVIINMLTRYARTQFVSPNPISEAQKKTDPDEKTDENNEKSNDDENSDKDDFDSKFNLNEDDSSRRIMDPDHRLLLRVTKPLLQSRNSAVVMAVAQLYYYVAPRNEAQIVAKSLVRLLRSHREVQIIVLKNIVSMAQKNHSMFQAHQKSFFVHSNDNIQIKLLKLEILTCLANESNISVILREFQAYVLSNDKEFAAATIHAIGRCASNIKEVSENCLSGLVNLMSKKDETVVAESVIVIKRLLQSNPSKNGHIVKKMAKMTDKVTVASARASIIWLIGEYSDRVNKIAPDVLRKMAKSFCDEDNVVKLQILNLAAKLYLTNFKQASLLAQYVFNLAKYDQNYDVRDKARFIRALLINNEKCPNLAKHLNKIFLSSKPAPVLQSAYKDTDQFQLGTLSHALSMRVSGYSDIPDFPDQAPDPTVRNIEVISDTKSNDGNDNRRSEIGSSKNRKSERFYSDDEEEASQSTEGADPTEDSENEESEKSEEDTDKNEVDEDEEEDDDEDDKNEESEEESEDESGSEKSDTAKKTNISKSGSNSDEDSEEKEDQDSSEEDSESESSEDQTKNVVVKNNEKLTSKTQEIKKKPKSVSTSESESSSEESSDDENDKKSQPKSQPPKTSTNLKSSSSNKVQNENKPKGQNSKTNQAPPVSEQISLLDLDFTETGTGNMATNFPKQSNVSFLSPNLAELANLGSSSNNSNFMSTQSVNTSKKEYELLNKINGNGLQIQYRFLRSPNNFSNKAVSVELKFDNHSNGDLTSFKITNRKLQSGMSMSELNEFDLAKNASSKQTIAIDFNDTLQSAQFELSAIYSNDPLLGGTSSTRKWPNLTIACPIGELVQPGWSISENEFNKLQANLKGMNEVTSILNDFTHALFISKNYTTKLLENVNMCQIPSSQQDTIKFAALTTSSKTPLVLSLFFMNSSKKCQINVNCEKIVLANMFSKEIMQLLSVS